MDWMPGWFREDRRAATLGVALVLIALIAPVLVIAQPSGNREHWLWPLIGVATAFAAVAILLIILGFLSPKLSITEVETPPEYSGRLGT